MCGKKAADLPSGKPAVSWMVGTIGLEPMTSSM